jgi:hypothetical protein
MSFGKLVDRYKVSYLKDVFKKMNEADDDRRAEKALW